MNDKDIEELMDEAALAAVMYFSKNPVDNQFSKETGQKWLKTWLVENIGKILK